MTDPRDLIQRLYGALRNQADDNGIYRQLIAEARAYLATPEPAAGPTDDDAENLADCAGLLSGYADLHPCGFYVRDSDLGAFARAVLARYGHRPPQPIPLSERLPEPEDCDAEGCCWFLEPGACWWEGYAEKICASPYRDTFTHWLPHHALPLPEVEP